MVDGHSACRVSNSEEVCVVDFRDARGSRVLVRFVEEPRWLVVHSVLIVIFKDLDLVALQRPLVVVEAHNQRRFAFRACVGVQGRPAHNKETLDPLLALGVNLRHQLLVLEPVDLDIGGEPRARIQIHLYPIAIKSEFSAPKQLISCN